MLDPLTSISLATNIVQLVDFGLKVANTGRQIATTGSTQEHRHLEYMSKNIARLCDEVEAQSQKASVAGLHRIQNDKNSTQSSSSPTPESKDNAIVKSLAARTRSTAEELNMLLQGLKLDTPAGEESPAEPSPTGHKRKRSAINRIVKAVWKDSDVQKLRKQLGELQQELMLGLNVMQSHSSSQILRQLEPTLKNTELQKERTLRFHELQKLQPDTLQKAEHNTNSSNEQGQIDLLARFFNSMSSQIQTVNRCQRILNSLAFEEINWRQNNITPAHVNTFDWIFKNSKLGFTEWAESKDGLFWITGKAGSGKSTLMKYIVDDPRTTRHLQAWARQSEVTLAYHFFWTSGTPMQKSQAGLLRTLLYHIVRQCPEKSLELVPQRFQDANTLGAMPWTLPELCKTLEAFGRQRDLGARLCFFIDGLDEYHGEHQDLVDYITRLSKCPSFKLCVSSRPWNVFSCAYDKKVDGQLAMQALTRSDIQIYVNDKMNTSPLFRKLRESNPVGCASLVKDISAKAQGVFLWVYLVVRSLLRGVNNSDSLDILRQRLDQYPQTLDKYFGRMFERIEDLYRRTSARIILVALKAEKPLPYGAPRSLEQEMDDPDYCLNQSIQTTNIGPTSYEMEACRRYLDARCADLLELTPSGICFLHRTARDFLEQRKLKEELTQHAGPNFDAGMSLARLTLMHIKLLSDDRGGISAAVRDLLSYEHIIQEHSAAAYSEVLQNFHNNGDAIFDALGGEVCYFAETKDGLALLESSESYEQSLLSMEVVATLVRIRDDKLAPAEDRIIFSEIDTEAKACVDFQYLFANDQSLDWDFTWNSWDTLISHDNGLDLS